MISASFKMVVLLLALLAGGFAMHDATSTSQAILPYHAVVLGSDVALEILPAPNHVLVRADLAEDVSRSSHDHGSGRGCPTDGLCCDAFCHVVMAVSVPEPGAINVTFASYIRLNDPHEGSFPVVGPERPPRFASV